MLTLLSCLSKRAAARVKDHGFLFVGFSYILRSKQYIILHVYLIVEACVPLSHHSDAFECLPLICSCPNLLTFNPLLLQIIMHTTSPTFERRIIIKLCMLMVSIRLTDKQKPPDYRYTMSGSIHFLSLAIRASAGCCLLRR